MKIRTNGIYIVGYVRIGNVKGDWLEIDQSILPDNFFDDFVPEKFLYSDGKVTENPDYRPPEPEPEPEEPTQDEINLDFDFRITCLELGI